MSKSKYKIIAESSNNLRIELIESINQEDSIQIIELSKELELVFGGNASLNPKNINK